MSWLPHILSETLSLQQFKRSFRLNTYLHNIKIFSAHIWECSQFCNDGSLSIDIQLKKYDIIIWFLINFSYEMWSDGSPRYPDHITGPEPPWERPDFRYLFFIVTSWKFFSQIILHASIKVFIWVDHNINSILTLICVSQFLQKILNYSLLAFAIGTEKLITRLNNPDIQTFQSCNL